MTGIIYGRPIDSSDSIQLWRIDGDTLTSYCGEYSYTIRETDNSGVKATDGTSVRVYQVIQRESLSKPLTSYCDECVKECSDIN